MRGRVDRRPIVSTSLRGQRPLGTTSVAATHCRVAGEPARWRRGRRSHGGPALRGGGAGGPGDGGARGEQRAGSFQAAEACQERWLGARLQRHVGMQEQARSGWLTLGMVNIGTWRIKQC